MSLQQSLGSLAGPAAAAAQLHLQTAARVDAALTKQFSAFRPWQVALVAFAAAWLLSRVWSALLRQLRLVQDKGGWRICCVSCWMRGDNSVRFIPLPHEQCVSDASCTRACTHAVAPLPVHMSEMGPRRGLHLVCAGLVQTLFIIVKSLPGVRGYAAREQAKIVVSECGRRSISP